MTDVALDRIWQHLQLAGSRTPADTLYLSAILDHDLIPERLHRWIFRRWSMFYVSVNSATAIFLSLVVGPLLGITLCSTWPCEALATMLLLSMLAKWAWHDTMGMLDFQARRLKVNQTSSDELRQPASGGTG